MRVHVISNIDNGKGLEQDYRLLRAAIEGMGHEVLGVHYEQPEAPGPADLAIFLEVYVPRLCEGARRRWLVPNAEWWRPERAQEIRDFDLVLCKTRHALRCFAPRAKRARFLGFYSEDRWDPAVPRERAFLHVAGGSIAKGTDSVLAAWERYRLPYPLTVVTSLGWPRWPRHVEMVGRLSERRLRHLQNASIYHLCPSRYEGWGHGLHEGLSVGAAVTILDTPDMAEVDGCAWRVPASPAGEQGLVMTHSAAPEDIRDAVERCAAFTEADLRRIREAAREAFLGERERCLGALRAALGGGESEVGGDEGSGGGGVSLEGYARAVRAAAAPRLRGHYGGVIVAGRGAERIAADVVRLCGLAAQVVAPESLGELPDSYGCGAILGDVFEGRPAEERERLLREVRRAVKAAGPIILAETVRDMESGEEEVRVVTRYARM